MQNKEVLHHIQALLDVYKQDYIDCKEDKRLYYQQDEFHEGMQNGELDIYERVLNDLEFLKNFLLRKGG